MHLIDDISHRNPDGTFNAVIEIPAGTVDKWETRKTSGALYRPKKDGQFRRVDYLPYPGNYGFIPRTLSDKALGGDGDPVDVIVISPKVARGSVQKVRVIGALRLLDEGEQDDKLIAVPLTGPFRNIRDLAGLKQTFPGVLSILEAWFSNYDGPGVTKIRSIADRADAERIIAEGHQSWQACPS